MGGGDAVNNIAAKAHGLQPLPSLGFVSSNLPVSSPPALPCNRNIRMLACEVHARSLPRTVARTPRPLHTLSSYQGFPYYPAIDKVVGHGG